MTKEIKHKAGFVSIIGKPNVGKSTLINQILNYSLSIISPKAQTTRHRILGILNEEDYQIIFSDLPGVLSPKYKLQETMMQEVNKSFADADVFVFMVESGQNKNDLEDLTKKINSSKKPVFVLVNKVDLSDQEKILETINFWQNEFPESKVIPISATENFGVDLLLEEIKEVLPVHPPFFDKSQITDKSERFLVNEKVREKILFLFKKEIPYSVEVITTEFKEQPQIIKIYSTIFVERKSQKGIIIGHQGKALTKLGTAVRRDLEKLFQKKIFIEIRVKVKENWRNNDRDLKNFGYLTKE